MPTASVGKRLPSIRLMEADLSAGFASAPAGFLKKIAQFVPYTFKELLDLELVEFSAMNAFNLLKYVAGIQRLCVPEHVFWYAFWNTDAEGDRLLIKGCSGTTCVVGWSTHFTTPQVYAYMRSLHGFQTNWAKVILHNLRTGLVFLQKRARTVENTKPTPVIWAPRFTRILFAFRETIFSGTPLALPDGWVAWTHMSKEGELDLASLHAKFPDPIVHLNVIRDNCKLTDQIPLAEPINGDSLAVAGTAPITSKLPARKRPRDDQDAIQVRTPANKDNGQSSTSPERTIRTRLTKKRALSSAAVGNSDVITVPADSTSNGETRSDPIFQDFGKILGPHLAQVVTSKLAESVGPMLADADAAASLKQQLLQQSQKLADHNGQLAALKLELEITKAKCQLPKDRSAELQLQKDLGQCRQQLADSQANLRKLETELKKAWEDAGSRAANQETLKGEVTSLKEKLEALKVAVTAKETKMSEAISDLQQRLQTEGKEVVRYKEALQAEMKKNADLDDQVSSLKGLIEDQKFTSGRAEKVQQALRSELSQVKTQLRMLQMAGK
ncbi:hypothetical protein R1sor_007586 [Riccia sorocarpa]|uniref:Uncharacterized protein n=1 Tax=Riccia sorocarpa TaxID=122646 RepID=A0ABD3HV28_9MARC